jgi:hypothetical protein
MGLTKSAFRYLIALIKPAAFEGVDYAKKTGRRGATTNSSRSSDHHFRVVVGRTAAAALINRIVPAGT